MSTVLMPYDRYKEAEKALAENAILRERLAAAERERDELRLKTAMTLGVGEGSGQLFVHGDYESIKACQRIIFEREAFWKKLDAMEIERDEANESARQAIERIAGYIGMIEARDATIAAQSAALAKARELVERARLNLSYSRQDAVPTAAEAESNRNSAFHNCFEALAAIDATLAGRAEV